METEVEKVSGKGKTRTIYFRVPVCLHEAIRNEATQVGLSITDVIRRIFEDRYQVRLIDERHAASNVSKTVICETMERMP